MDNDKNPRARVRDLMGDGYSYTSNTLRSRARACEAGARVRGFFTVRRLCGRWTRRLTSLAALRAEHENPPRRGIGLTADWSPRERQRARASSASAAPAASTPPGFPQRGGTRKSHERSRHTCRTQGPGKGSRCWRKANGPFLASSSFVTFRAIFVSRDFGITRRVGTWRRRRVKRSFEPGDGSALPIAEGDSPRSRVFVFRAKRP